MNEFKAAPVLAQLKDFQRRTVDFVFDRLYGDDAPTRRFLVADEVGLGKTMVAKGVIARAIEHLEGRAKRIDIVYVCSNAAIAQQNVSRLNVLGSGDFAIASRLTLLPTQVHDLRNNPVNFVSFTPGTTFDLKSRSGVMHERSVLFRMLKGEGWLDERGLLHLLQATAGRAGWENAAYHWVYKLDAELSEDLRKSLRADPEIQGRLTQLCNRFHRYRESVPQTDNEDRLMMIGELRSRLARVCLEALEPDLIILDEFQRFRNLLRADDPTAALAQDLFNQKDVRVLMLSATPYKMLSLDHEQEDDHYPDFLKTLEFLHGDPAAVDDTRAEIDAFRHALLDLDAARPEVVTRARQALERRLRTVMCRTERVGFTARQDAMVTEPPRPAALHAGDLHHAALVDGVSRAVGSRDAIEYWKSTPYALNFLGGYEVRRKLDRLDGEQLANAAKLVHRHGQRLLSGAAFEDYERVDPANARLRSLFADTIDRELWRVLWLPPSFPTWQPGGDFAGLDGVTKSLVFSAWNAVPDAIAALTSYEAERQMITALGRSDVRHSSLYDRLKPLLRFSKDADDRLTGMPTLLLLYPSPALASLVDPVALALDAGTDGPPALATVVAAVTSRLRDALDSLAVALDPGGREDERWYWLAPALLDRMTFPGVGKWCASSSGWRAAGESQDADPGAAFREHLDHLVLAACGGLTPPLGRPPDDLAAMLAELTLAGPAVCALRSLRRVGGDLAWDDGRLLGAAARVASGFRSLFNVPESIALLRGSDDTAGSYWRLALRHGLEGNLGALLDEQVHVLQESLGVLHTPAPNRVQKIAEELNNSLSIRTAQISVDELQPRPKAGRFDIDSIKLRCRFALRFGEMKQDEKTEARIENVRSAFNSPFRPFVLASTSVGQEGLDFHTWCHAIMHWNLPSNPVDLEQREGRVHRYKGHAVRKNVANSLGLRALREFWKPGQDPWVALFSAARTERSGDLLTYWLFETDGGATIERRVPLLPLSQDGALLARLKRGLALYRLVFGQPRQEDLLAHLATRLGPEDVDAAVAAWRIDLAPPAILAGRDSDFARVGSA